jgi:hypothetical protein
MSRSNRDETDSETNRKPVAFNDETLPVISCKEIVQKDPVFVFMLIIFNEFNIYFTLL